MRRMNKFHIIGCGFPSYHVMLGRVWIQRREAVPSSYCQCVKVFWKGKKIHVCATYFPFQQDETRFSEAAFFNELVEDGEAVPQGPRIRQQYRRIPRK